MRKRSYRLMFWYIIGMIVPFSSRIETMPLFFVRKGVSHGIDLDGVTHRPNVRVGEKNRQILLMRDIPPLILCIRGRAHLRLLHEPLCQRFCWGRSPRSRRSLRQPPGRFGLCYLLPINIGSRVWVDTADGFQSAGSKHLEFAPRLAIFSETE